MKRHRKRRPALNRSALPDTVADRNSDSGEETEESEMEQRPPIDYSTNDNIANNMQDVKEEYPDAFGRIRPNVEFEYNHGNEGGSGTAVNEDKDNVDPMDSYGEEDQPNGAGILVAVEQEPMELVPIPRTTDYKPSKKDFIRVSALLLMDHLLKNEKLGPVARAKINFEIGVALNIYDKNDHNSFTNEDIKQCFDLFVANPITPVPSKSEIVSIDRFIDQLQNRFGEFFTIEYQLARALRFEMYHPILEADNIQAGCLEVARKISYAISISK